MFDKFGEFDSADEMNRAAAAQRKEGDNEAILAIAEENGIDKEDAMDFIDGCVAAFVTPLMAAYGKLDIEAKELNPYEIMEDWLQYIKLRCAEEPEMAVVLAVLVVVERSIALGAALQLVEDSDILKAVKINYKVTLGIPGMGRAKKIITEYYMRKEQ